VTHTQNYNLTQWSPADRILRSDFNTDNAAIDTALADHAAQLAKLGNCGIETYTYTGTGTCGTEHPTVIPFSRMPTFFILIGYYVLITGAGGAEKGTGVLRIPNGGGCHTASLLFDWNGPTLRFIQGDAINQANDANKPYFAIAFYAEDKK